MTRKTTPWGEELLFALTNQYAGKILTIYKNRRLSLQYHETKQESIFVLSGRLEVTWEAGNQIFYPGDAFHVPAETVHRFKGLDDCQLIEVSTPELDDVVRLADDYGRCDAKKNAAKSKRTKSLGKRVS